MNEEKEIVVTGARVHNLKNINVCIPRNQLTVITGLSGSGKSSLAFDTIYAEGQRRYMETLSAYARQFMGSMERPDVEKITGLSPVIAIEQKTTNKNPRSTVGTITEIYDFLRLLFARAATAYSMETNEEMVRYTDDQIVDLIITHFNQKKTAILVPLVKGRKGHYKDLFEGLAKKGFTQVRVNDVVQEITVGMKLERYKNHFIEVVIDKLLPSSDDKTRLRDSVALAMKHGKGVLMVLEMDRNITRFFSRHLMCPTSGISYSEPAPHNFSFNSPQGACPTCNGLGVVPEIDRSKLIPDPNLSIKRGGIAPIGPYKSTLLFMQLDALAKKYNFSLSDPIKDIPEASLNILLNGSEELLKIENSAGVSSSYSFTFEGIINIVYQPELMDDSEVNIKSDRYVQYITCPDCQGARLKKEALYFRLAGKNIAEYSAMDIDQLSLFIQNIDPLLTEKQRLIGTEVLKEIANRLQFLTDVGLNYLSLNRSTRSLSGGESQRIRLATQIGSKLVNVLYILDEPSIGLHQRDNLRLIQSLKQLRDAENTVIVVEHDEDMIRSADYVLDIGPQAGIHGGQVVASGTPTELLSGQSLTAQYLNGNLKIEVPKKRRKGNGNKIQLKGATGNNLKNVSVDFPLGMLICVTGVSGSGKSTLINETLQPILSQHFYRSLLQPLAYTSVTGLEHIDKVVQVDQSPIGRTPRSNPATYTNLFADIRKLFEACPEAKIRGYKAGRFSFNVKGGRCEECRGAGLQTIEMNFLPDVYVTCKQCNGKRYNRETLEVRYKGKSINDVLNMTIEEACVFFEHQPSLFQRVKCLNSVGLGYVQLGQSCTTLSGGESQRVKLAAELSKKDTGNTFYILDEPTTGLHFEDVRVLMGVLNQLVEKGNTVLVIEHNLDVVKLADYIIDVGPEGGAGGGKILFSGTPEKLINNKESYTAKYLSSLL